MSIKERIQQIQENSTTWRTRVPSAAVTDNDDLPSMEKIRQSLASSQGEWRKRVEDKDAKNFTVAGRLGQLGRQQIQRSLTIHVTRTPDDTLEPRPCPLNLDYAVNFPCRPPAVPVARATSKENRPTPKLFTQRSVDSATPSLPPLLETSKQTVAVPSFQDNMLMDFFSSAPLVESEQSDEVHFPEPTPSQRNEQLQSSYQRIAADRRAVRPARRKASKTPNPLKTLAQRTDLRMEYEEVRCSSAATIQCRTPIPYHQLLQTIDPTNRLRNEAAMRRSMLADSAIAGLSSTENFSDAKSGLRQVSSDQPLPLTQFQRQLLPYKQIMLLHVKGRRQVQVRLVSPSANSMNSGDCYVLVTANAVFAWFGSFANVVEINKARELAAWIHKTHELSFRSVEASDYISIQEEIPDPHASDIEALESGMSKARRNSTASAVGRFWKALGYDEPQAVQGE